MLSRKKRRETRPHEDFSLIRDCVSNTENHAKDLMMGKIDLSPI
jgi:hypothetical protein